MLSSVTSQLKASIQQHVPRYASQTSQQSNNLTLPQVPPPWMVQWSSSHSDWLYVNQETNQQSWVHPNQRPPQQSHDPYQSNIFSAPLAHQSQSTSQNPAFSPPPPQQHWQPDHQNPSFCPPSQESYPLPQQQSYSPYHPTASPSPPQQSQGRPAYQGFPIQPLPQVIPQSLSRPQHLYTTFPSWTSQEKPPHSIAPARKSRNGRNIVLGLGALVASAIGVDMLSDSDDEDSGGKYLLLVAQPAVGFTISSLTQCRQWWIILSKRLQQ